MPLSLIFGIALGGLITGYMVAGSATPVVGAVVPALVSAFVGGLALIFRNPFDSHLNELLKESDGRDKALMVALRDWRIKRESVAPQLGTILVSFFVFYGIGCLLGTLARTQKWFDHQEQASELLSTVAGTANSIEETLDRISLYRILDSNGLNEKNIRNIMSKPVQPAEPIVSQKELEILISTATNSASVAEAFERIAVFRALQRQGFDALAIKNVLALPLTSSPEKKMNLPDGTNLLLPKFSVGGESGTPRLDRNYVSRWNPNLVYGWNINNLTLPKNPSNPFENRKPDWLTTPGLLHELKEDTQTSQYDPAMNFQLNYDQWRWGGGNIRNAPLPVTRNLDSRNLSPESLKFDLSE